MITAHGPKRTAIYVTHGDALVALAIASSKEGFQLARTAWTTSKSFIHWTRLCGAPSLLLRSQAVVETTYLSWFRVEVSLGTQRWHETRLMLYQVANERDIADSYLMPG